VLKTEAERLPWDDGIFDCYVSNYVLHEVENPMSQILEAYRVLKTGGVAAFSVWGTRENSNSMTVVENAYIKSNFEVPKIFEGFWLSQSDLLKEILYEAEFGRVHIFSKVYPFPFDTVEKAMEFYTSHPMYK
jgi:ubiquinone/menaquinone biosynthesis C-methylase UbiE